MNTLIKLANNYIKQRKETHSFMSEKGYVLIYQNEVIGWRNELRNPEDFLPGVYAIDTHKNLFITTGGDDKNGSKAWYSF